MGYKCQHCGWTPKESDFYLTTDDINIIFNHEKTCPVKKRDVYNGTYR